MYGPREIEFTPSAPSDFVTLADVKGFIGISGVSDDVLLARLIKVASRQIESYCGTVFPQRTVTETMRTEDCVSSLVLGVRPVISLTSLKIADQTQNVADFRLNKSAGYVRRKDGSIVEFGEHEAVYEAGYATLPETVVQAALELVRDLYNSRQSDPRILSEDVPDVGAVEYRDADGGIVGNGGARVGVSVAALLAPYVVRFVP